MLVPQTICGLCLFIGGAKMYRHRSWKEFLQQVELSKIICCWNRSKPWSLAIVWKQQIIHSQESFVYRASIPLANTSGWLYAYASCRCVAGVEGSFCVVFFFFFLCFQGDAARLFPLHTAAVLSRSSCCAATGPGIYGQHKKCLHCLSPCSSRFKAHSTITLN